MAHTSKAVDAGLGLCLGDAVRAPNYLGSDFSASFWAKMMVRGLRGHSFQIFTLGCNTYSIYIYIYVYYSFQYLGDYHFMHNEGSTTMIDAE